ncbi:hypothetical protein L596_024965 [Steinernema carpocapsae]|uniref:DNA polymerase delta subunit OB-fold domain-containing protein n=1 Tax=Steinernema carpocapsae TaxID=34508 RepID=A0A4U5M6E6_STECR|nr:hypothetical protein L596_024965 [Steinernema carpocapsae]
MQLKEEAMDEKFPYENLCAQFLMKPEDHAAASFKRQFCFFYQERIEAMRPRILERARKEIDPDPVQITRLVGLKPNKKVVIVGLVLKHMKRRPSVLREMAKEDDGQEVMLPDPLIADRLIAEEDWLEFEDGQQMVKLEGNIDKNLYVTGCVIGLYGHRMEGDKFHVDRVVTPSIKPQAALPPCDEDRYIAFISGLQITAKVELDSDLRKALASVQSFLCNEFGEFCDENGKPYKIERLVIAGESIGLTEEGHQYSTSARYLTRNEEAPSLAALRQLDAFISTLTGAIPVDLMPGPSDPASIMYPQQPMHKACFPSSSHHGKMINFCTNPHISGWESFCSWELQ